MPTKSSFPSWLSSCLGNSEVEIRRLLKDESALYFLIAWSLFESKCFQGFVKAEEIENFAERVSPTINLRALQESVKHFYERYQNPELLKNLMHNKNNPRLLELLTKPFNNICNKEIIYFLVFVIYRYRNNIFHGNKGVQSWLNYQEQIKHCTRAMQVMISHAESNKPTMDYGVK